MKERTKLALSEAKKAKSEMEDVVHEAKSQKKQIYLCEEEIRTLKAEIREQKKA